MATFSSLQRQHVLQAIAEYDERGEVAFLEAYGFAAAADHPLLHEGARYDARAVLGVAHRYATGRTATPEEVANGLTAAVAILRKRGFEVIEPATASRAVPARRPAPRATTPRRAAAPRTASTRSSRAEEPAPRICPTCYTALPATGICDTCG